MSLDSTIALIGNIAIALSFIAALIFGIAQTRSWAKDRRERLTLETIRNFGSREFAEMIYFIRDLPPPQSGEEFRALPQERQVMLIQYGQVIESLGMLVYEKYIDLDLIDKTIGSFVSTSWEKYRPMFTQMRVELNDPYLGEYFQWLAECVDDRLTNHPREPYYIRTRK